jgi:toxoflavin biosynthesis protein ToxC
LKKEAAMHHSGPISGIATSSRYIATTGYDNQVILWDAATNTALARSLHDHLANQCAFSPDERLLVSASSDYTARIWEVPSMRLKAVLIGHDDDIDMAAFSPDGQYVATCSLDRSIKIFTLDGECINTFRGHTGDVLSVTWSRDGRHLISCGVDGTVRKWNADPDAAQANAECGFIDMGGVRTDTLIVTGADCIFAGDDMGRIAIIWQGTARFVQAHQAGIKRIVHHGEAGLLATLSYDRSVAVWQIGAEQDLTEISRTTIPAVVWPRSGAFLGNSEIVFGTFGSTYAIFNWTDNAWEVDGVVPDTCINAVTVCGSDVYSIGDAGTVLKNGEKSVELGSLCNFLLVFGATIVTGGQLGKLFDATTGEMLYEHHSPLNCGTTFMRNGKLHAAIGTYTGEALIFSQEKGGSILFVTSLKIYENAIKGIIANERTLFSVCASTAVAWHDIGSLTATRVVEHAHERIANGCCLLQGYGFASIGRDLKLRLWNEDSANEHETYDTPHRNSVKCISASADGKTIMTGSYGGTLAAFDVERKRWHPISRPTATGISSIAFDACNGRFLASSYDGHIYVS